LILILILILVLVLVLVFSLISAERRKSTQAEACATKSRVTTRFDIKTLHGK